MIQAAVSKAPFPLKKKDIITKTENTTNNFISH
jgi:hypothetical protein